MAYLTVKKDISFWPVSEEWSVIFSRSKGKSICIPTEWKDTLLSKVCDLKNDFDDQTLQLFIDYGLLQTANDNVDQNTENDIIQNRKFRFNRRKNIMKHFGLVQKARLSTIRNILLIKRLNILENQYFLSSIFYWNKD